MADRAPFVAAVGGTARAPMRLLVRGAARSIGVVALTLLGYGLLPVEGTSSPVTVAVGAGLAMTVLLVIFAWQLSRISRAEHPLLASLEAVSLIFGMFVVLFALMYVALSVGNPDAFTEQIDKVGGIYFTTTVLTTVGFGDISPVTDTARVLVTVEMVLGMILIGSAFKVIANSARRNVSSKAQGSTSGAGA